ncbi:ribonuclease-III-like-domain-containing protein [Bombardia bombarda]|uniref:Ribonuclease-III-like-domain-containing protein n=1 Tax=Bombardia bombarda TaxID=252184 RepID=A0AA39WBC9_9PEZI|nr:ribonuclease-III-like-domain-containing protein [Bombardia bombarda]
MALNSSRSTLSSACTALRQCRRHASLSISPISISLSSRQLSTTPARCVGEQAPSLEQLSQTPSEKEPTSERSSKPRWSYTPEGMKGPGFSINVVKDPRRKIWVVNEDPAALDVMYQRLLGTEGNRLLPDEIKWLAITHKSFDFGRRGNNTRLGYFGRQVLAVESTRTILVSTINDLNGPIPDSYGRTPFSHPALTNADKLNEVHPQSLIDREKMASVAVDVGLPSVMRWKPRLPENLEGSGIVAVLNTTMFAIFGAIALQHGSEAAQRLFRDRLLSRLQHKR